MSHNIVSAIILNGIFDRMDRADTGMSTQYGIKYTIPCWFQDLHPIPPFPKDKPTDPYVFDSLYENEKEEWERAYYLKMLRKWVFWCAEFCDASKLMEDNGIFFIPND